jgi:hypothetical protein
MSRMQLALGTLAVGRINAQGFSPGYAEGGNIEGPSLTAQGFSPGYAINDG